MRGAAATGSPSSSGNGTAVPALPPLQLPVAVSAAEQHGARRDGSRAGNALPARRQAAAATTTGHHPHVSSTAAASTTPRHALRPHSPLTHGEFAQTARLRAGVTTALHDHTFGLNASSTARGGQGHTTRAERVEELLAAKSVVGLMQPTSAATRAMARQMEAAMAKQLAQHLARVSGAQPLPQTTQPHQRQRR